MIEKNPIAGKKAVRLAIVDRDVIGIGLGTPIRRTRVKWRLLCLRYFKSFAEEFRGRSLIEPGAYSRLAYGFQNADGSQASYLTRVLRHIKTNAHVRLGAQI